jgi:uncharacterized membrane protein YkoI
MWRILKPTTIAVVASAALMATSQAALSNCLPWSAAGPVIAKNGLVSADVVYQKVKARTGGKIVNASLCEDGGHFVYKFVVLGPTGEVTNLTVDALTGQP